MMRLRNVSWQLIKRTFRPDTVPEDAPLLEVVNTDTNESKTTRLLVRDLSFGTLKG